MKKRTKLLDRTAGGFTAALYSHPSFIAMRALHVGCVFAWARLALDAGSATVPREVLQDHAAHFAGLDQAEFEQLLRELAALRVVEVQQDGAITLTHLAAAMGGRSAEADRRRAGWEKRRQASAPAPSVSAPAPARSPAPAAPLPAPLSALRTPAPLQASLLESDSGSDSDSVPASPAQARPAKSAAPDSQLRIGAGEGDESPTIARLEAKGGQVVEFTQSFADSMAQLYPGVDVAGELLRAAEWCRGKPERRKTVKGARAFVTGWLSRTSQRREITMAVVASDRQRNGFGQGGRYEGYGAGQASQADLDDLVDLLPTVGTRLSESRTHLR